MKAAGNRSFSERVVTIAPGFEQLRARLRPGQFLRARILYFLDRDRFLLRLLGKTVVASSTERLASGQDVWVRVRSVLDKVHLNLLDPRSLAGPIAQTAAGSETAAAWSGNTFVRVDNRRETVLVAVQRLGSHTKRPAWSIVLSVEDEPAASLRFVLEESSGLLTVRLVSSSAELVRSFLESKIAVERIAIAAGFSRVRVGAKRLTNNDDEGAELSDFGIDVVV